MAGSEFRQPRLGFATPRDPVWQGCRGFRHEHSGIAPRLCSRTPSRMIMGDILPLSMILSSLRFLVPYKWGSNGIHGGEDVWWLSLYDCF